MRASAPSGPSSSVANQRAAASVTSRSDACVSARCAARGVELKWFGAPDPVGFTSRYEHWRYAAPNPLPQTDAVLAGLIDMRLPLTFSLEDAALIARIIRAEVLAVAQGEVAPVAALSMGD